MDEDLCQRCGRCCLLKEEIDNGVWACEPRFCHHVVKEGETLKCAIYKKRLGTVVDVKLENGDVLVASCYTADTLARARLLPDDCPYARRIPEYRSRVINYDDAVREARARLRAKN